MVKLCKKFSTHSHTSLVQDPMVKHIDKYKGFLEKNALCNRNGVFEWFGKKKALGLYSTPSVPK